MEIQSLTKKELLTRAREYLFSTGLNDGASNLSKYNSIYGLAQFHYIQEKNGLEPNATFIASPDETISKNNFRWNSGIGYGGRLSWGSGRDPLIFLNIKPNCCGILVGGLEEALNPKKLIEKINEIKDERLFIGDIPIKWDYGISNHFINFYETKNLSDIDLPPYIFMIHGSAPEYRDDEYGLGLYIDHSKKLKEMAIQEETPFGTQYILIDSDAKEYLDFCKRVLKFSNEKREVIGKLIFGSDYTVVTNQPHQFLKDCNNIFLGCNCTDLSCDLIDSNIFPITLRADIAAYLFEGKKNFSTTILKNLDFLERAQNLGLLDLLSNADILPHGGGYSMPDIKKVKEIINHKGKRHFLCELSTKKDRMKIIKDIGSLEYDYRGRDVVFKTLQLDLGDLIARLKPIFSFKL